MSKLLISTESRVLLVKKQKQKLVELTKGKLLREKEIQIYEQLIASRESILNDPTTKPIKRVKLEWEVQGLKEDVQRWKETLGIIDKMLTDECCS